MNKINQQKKIDEIYSYFSHFPENRLLPYMHIVSLRDN